MHFSGIVAVRFTNILELKSDDGDVFKQRGFTIVIGCNAPNIRRAFELICNVVEKEAASITDSFELEQMELQHIDKKDWDKDIIKKIKDWEKEIYYVSGKVFYEP